MAAAALILALATPALAHPGIGVVVDRRGNAYYTDLRHVWRQAYDGTTEIVVRDVHTHELLLRGDTLYGEHLWYDAGTWHHRVWRRTPDGRLEDVIAARTGFREDYDDFHFVRDSAGAMYWADQESDGSVTHVHVRGPGGAKRIVATVPARHPGWLAVSPAGTVYLVANGVLYRAASGRAEVVARGVSEHSKVPWYMRALGWGLSVLRIHDGPDHDVGGVWLDENESVYVAVPGGGVVKRITRAGLVSEIGRSPTGWEAVGGTIHGDQLLLLEVGAGGSARVRRVPLN